MVLLLRKRHLLTVVAAAALCGALLLTARPGAAAVSGSASPQRAVILDAGHGGADGGAVSDSGVAESGLNLAITLRLADVLTFCGYEVLLTRTGEAALCDDPAATLRQQKVSDTKKRVEIINRCADARLISIHQNSLPGHPGVSGAQVFHNGQDGAEALALCIQNDLNMAVNTREKAAKRIDDSIYIMKHADCPAVLVECGFLSNPQEAENLKDEEYQNKIAFSIFAAINEYLAKK